MKIGKKTTALLAFSMGAVVFATSAMADMAIGSGYNSLKNAAKETMAKLTKDVDNFQVDMKMNMKLDGNEFESESGVSKIDMAGKRQETQSTRLEDDGTTRSDYNYSDAEMSVYKTDDMEKYNVYKREFEADSYTVMENPFEDEVAADVEKIVDAFVGNLKDVIQLEELDGKKMYVGNLTETQVPTLANALLSFAVKYSVMDNHRAEEMKLPKITNDFCVRSASGKAIENEQGILEDVLGTITLGGTDENGNSHDLTIEVSMALSGIGKTEVVTPELTDDNAEFTTASSRSQIDAKYIGVYKSDIIESGANSFRKVGERVIEITGADENGVRGRYYEVFVDGYTPKEPAQAFDFTESNDPRGERYGDSVVTYTDANGEQAFGMLGITGRMAANLRFVQDIKFQENGYSTSSKEGYEDELIRVFE